MKCIAYPLWGMETSPPLLHPLHLIGKNDENFEETLSLFFKFHD
jgi:hypothetical protein